MKVKTMQQQVIEQEKLAALGLLTKGLAHEIQNPLNFVNNFAELSSGLVEDLTAIIKSLAPSNGEHAEIAQEAVTLCQNLNENVKNIKNSGLRISDLVKSMNEHAKVGSGNRVSVDLNQLLQEQVELVTYNFSKKAPEVKINFEMALQDNLEKISCIPQDLARCLGNILDNACYSVVEKNSKVLEPYSPTIKVSLKTKENRVEIIIKDNGQGISKARLGEIFLPFYTTKPTGQGNTGLGLSIAHNIIVQEHSGGIKIKSEEGAYTEVSLWIPTEPMV